jgi:oxygen-dependent protoporphyrinogen oxidase
MAKAGWRVVLYDAREQAGGRMRSDVLDGCIVDPAVQLFGSGYRTLFRLAEEVGAGRLLERSAGQDALWRDGRAHTIAYGSVASLVRSTALPAGLKLRMGARYLPFLAAHARRLDANDPARTGGAELDGVSVAEWGRRELGEEFVELLAYPLLGAYYGGAPERISAALYHALAKAGTDVRLYGVAGGVGALSARVLAALVGRDVQWRGGDDVRHVSWTEREVSVESARGAETYDGAIVAVPARAALEVVAPATPLAAWLAAVEAAPTATLALLVDGELDTDYFGLSFPRASAPGDRIVVLCVERQKLPGLVPPGRALLVVYPAPAIASEIGGMDNSAAVERLMPAVETVFPGIGGRVVRARLYRFPEGYVVFRPGHLQHIACYDPEWLPPRVALAGEYLAAPTVEGAMLSGVRAAARLLNGGAK